MTASNRWLVIIGTAIASAVVVGIAVTMLASGERHYAEGTPERAVQDYLRAVADRDTTAALTYLAPDLAARCEPRPRESISSRSANSLRATLDRSTVRDATAEVRVRVTESYNSDGPFGGSDSSFTQVFVLKQVGGQWRFSEAPWPLSWLDCPPHPGPVAEERGHR